LELALGYNVVRCAMWLREAVMSTRSHCGALEWSARHPLAHAATQGGENLGPATATVHATPALGTKVCWQRGEGMLGRSADPAAGNLRQVDGVFFADMSSPAQQQQHLCIGLGLGLWQQPGPRRAELTGADLHTSRRNTMVVQPNLSTSAPLCLRNWFQLEPGVPSCL